MDSRWLGIFLVFAPLSLFSFGGGQAVIAEMQHQVVDVQHWMTNQEFVDLFALSRAAPGPSTLIAALIGWHVAASHAVAGTIGTIFHPRCHVCRDPLVARGAGRPGGARWSAAWPRVSQVAGAATVPGSQANALQLGVAVVGAGLLLYTRIGPIR
jgi:chromate transporter